MPSINWGTIQFNPAINDGPPPLRLRFRHPYDNHFVTIAPDWREDTSQATYEGFCLSIIDAMEDAGYLLNSVSRENTAFQSVSYDPGN